MSAPRLPARLGPAGRRFWREVLADFELPPDGLSLLSQVCRTVDELDRLTEALAAGEVLSVGSAGQPVAHPLLAEVRAHRATLAKLLAALNLPDEDDVQPLTATQERARNAAQQRWRAHREHWGAGGQATA